MGAALTASAVNSMSARSGVEYERGVSEVRVGGFRETTSKQNQMLLMFTFCGFDLELFVEDVLNRGDWPTLCCARDFSEDQWLIVLVDDDAAHLA